jgi:hypothetical protein
MKKEKNGRHQNNPLSGQVLLRSSRDARELARLARRQAVLATLAQFPRLRQGLVAAGLSWPACKGMMLHPGFRAAVRKIITAHRSAGAIQRRRKERVAVWIELRRAGLPRDVAYIASHQVVDPRPPPSPAEAVQGII